MPLWCHLSPAATTLCTVLHRTALYCTALHHLAPHQVSSAQLSQLPERVRKAKENTFLFHFKRPGACLKKWQIKEFTFNLHYILVWFPLNPAFPGSRLLRIGACTNVLRMYNKSIANPFTSTLVSVSVFFQHQLEESEKSVKADLWCSEELGLPGKTDKTCKVGSTLTFRLVFLMPDALRKTVFRYIADGALVFFSLQNP